MMYGVAPAPAPEEPPLEEAPDPELDAGVASFLEKLDVSPVPIFDVVLFS